MGLFTNADLISVYSTDQAIEDGVLHHPYPSEWPWLLVTDAVWKSAQNVSLNRRVDFRDVLRPFLGDCILAVQYAMRQTPDVDLVKVQGTCVGTVWVRPNDKKGMTVMFPEDH